MSRQNISQTNFLNSLNFELNNFNSNYFIVGISI